MSSETQDNEQISTREELIFLLSRASAFEHALACVSLFAAFSLKSDESGGGLTDVQADMVRSWRRSLASASVDRMSHLAQISNLLTAIGGVPHLIRPLLPTVASDSVSEVELSLEPFSQVTIDNLIACERPDAVVTMSQHDAAASIDEHFIASQVDNVTVGNLYDRIAVGLRSIPEQELFIGPSDAQVNPHFLNLDGQLISVVDRASASDAVAMIIGTGTEKAQSDHKARLDSLHKIRAEHTATMEEARQGNLPFEPTRPVAKNPRTHLHGEIGNSTPIVDALTVAVANLFNRAYDTLLFLMLHFYVHTEESDANRERLGHTILRLTNSVVRPLGEALTQMPIDSVALPGICAGPPFGDGGDVPEVLHQASAWALFNERLWQLAVTATKLRVTPGLPNEVQEASAALQDLVCQFAPADGPHSATARVAELRKIQAELSPVIQSSVNGPYLVTNVDHLVNWLGESIPVRPQMALCRCGASSIKPFCDGTHARIDFTGHKDPKRVPDRRDRYVGTAVTVLDNRGICAHSGFCTDRLSSVFQVGKEPFVVPNGARMDEIIRAVRSCPSGALSYAIGGVEVRAAVDQTRPPTIEVSKDGPYRITGSIALKDGQGNDEVRNTGVSLEHYSLCRCGHSQNKPFCSGMHWYVNFHDPEVSADHEPTLFEWAGGLPALTRMTHLFYDKYVPQEPLLEPLFGHMSPDHPERVASWLSEVFGGPKFYGQQYGDYTRMLSQHVGKCLTEAQRSRWASLMCQAADEAGVPKDPEFRSAFVSYIEWGSRIAVENSTEGAHPPLHMPLPRWSWGTAGAPGTRISALAPIREKEEDKAVPLPTKDEQVRFTQHIKPLFRAVDRNSMKWAFDLWSYQDVSQHAKAILQRLQNGTMPCDGAWPPEKVGVFQRWVESGTKE
jgi:CDGSH-type Zn-finger protein/truncated hemoglobin YjbI